MVVVTPFKSVSKSCRVSCSKTYSNSLAQMQTLIRQNQQNFNHPLLANILWEETDSPIPIHMRRNPLLIFLCFLSGGEVLSSTGGAKFLSSIFSFSSVPLYLEFSFFFSHKTCNLFQPTKQLAKEAHLKNKREKEKKKNSHISPYRRKRCLPTVGLHLQLTLFLLFVWLACVQNEVSFE